MQSMQFVAKSQLEAPEADVFFVEPKMLLEAPLICHTLYITCEIDLKTLDGITGHLPYGVLVVSIY